MSPRVAVLDYRMSNLRSATKALERLGADVRVATAPEEAEGADAVVLPGVGHFGEAMRRIRAARVDDAVLGAAARGVPADAPRATRFGAAMAGGCGTWFSRKDAYQRHLHNKAGVCFGDVDGEWFPQNQE